MKTYNEEDIAGFFLAVTDPDYGSLLTNLKLQKLCYYAAGIIAAVRQNDEHPLFHEPLKAWKHGPVLESLYQKFKDYGASGIPQPEEFDFAKIDDRDKEVLDDVFDHFGQFSAWKLREMTHSEKPWLEARQSADHIISNEKLRLYFSEHVTSRSYIDSYQNYEPK